MGCYVMAFFEVREPGQGGASCRAIGELAGRSKHAATLSL